MRVCPTHDIQGIRSIAVVNPSEYMQSKLNRNEVLLVHPLGYQANAAGNDIARVANIMPPIGLASLAAWLNKQGFATPIIDGYARPDSTQRLKEVLQDKRPAILGLSCTTSSFRD